MNINVLLPVISKALGRDLTPEVNSFYRVRAAIGISLNPQGQRFFMDNWAKIPDFMETQAGREAIATFMNSWALSLMPKTMAAEPIPEPAPLPALSDVPGEAPSFGA